MVTHRRILITGCSGGGKSSLIAEMAQRGWATVPEPGRRVIAREKARGGDGLPWLDMARFADLCADMAKQDWRAANAQVTLFDRGLIDAVLALYRLRPNMEIDTRLQECRYEEQVYLAPPWPEIFETDADRAHSFDEAMIEYCHIADALPDMGYLPVILPKIPVAARADWLENRLRNG